VREKIEQGEYYHIYNRGVDKRTIFEDKRDIARFIQSMYEFNVPDPIRSIRDSSGPTAGVCGLVKVLAYCLNPNHFHLILQEIEEGGISEYMKRLGVGYTCYFNNKYERNGSLFQGKYKYKHIENSDSLMYVSVYVNLNDKVHNYSGWTPVSSYAEYSGDKVDSLIYDVEGKEAVLRHFKDASAYVRFAKDTLKVIRENKEKYRGIL
jgi:REP element-mobilizing transposase RayT